ncbi:HipA domain-containing protein [Chitinophaga sp. 30R24]|uniref:HipA domain-containing protein n=1 Tax=Chitinophaga sp. 30R24 TaxID=3248838 RepID=UPI003B901EB8
MFDGKKVSHILSFNPPKGDNLLEFQQQTKRLSISGVQLKYSLRLEGTELVLSSNHGQYILKPIPPAAQLIRADQAPENEHLTMQIASQVFNIDTANNALIYFHDGTPAYITRRFDLKEDGTKYPQEDMAQLSGRTRQTAGEHFKYEGSYEEIGKLIRQHVSAYMPAMERYFKLLIFNYLFSNGDAHMKNFSLIQTPMGDYTLSKAYDLMSTVLHMPNESDTALELYKGDTDNEFYAVFGSYGQPHFRALGLRMGILPIRIERILTQLLTSSQRVKAMIHHSFLQESVKAKYEEAYQKKLRLMGMTKTMIAQAFKSPHSSSNNKAVIAIHLPVQLDFLRGPSITGVFLATDQSALLEKDNKYLFAENNVLEKYMDTSDETLLTLVDGDILINVTRL